MQQHLTQHTSSRRPLSLPEMIQAVDLIRDFMAERVSLNCSDSGLLNLFHRGSFDILLKAVDTHTVRGFNSNRSYILAMEVGAPAIIQLQIQLGPIHSATHMDYLLPQRGDDPVVLFINVLKDYFHGNDNFFIPSGAQIEGGAIQALLGE